MRHERAIPYPATSDAAIERLRRRLCLRRGAASANFAPPHMERDAESEPRAQVAARVFRFPTGQAPFPEKAENDPPQEDL